jgi:hypothetical protein
MMEVATYASGPPFHIKPLADGRTLDAARVGDELAKDDVTGIPSEAFTRSAAGMEH